METYLEQAKALYREYKGDEDGDYDNDDEED